MTNKPWDAKHQAFQETLRELREAKTLKQKELGDKLGKPQSYVSKYETGERKLEYLELLEILEVIDNTVQEFHELYLSKVGNQEVKADY